MIERDRRITDDDAVVFIQATNDIDLAAGLNGDGGEGGDITIEAFAGTGPTPPGGNVAVNTNGDGDFTVDGSTVLP